MEHTIMNNFGDVKNKGVFKNAVCDFVVGATRNKFCALKC